jgi:hypothetical protein
LHGQLADSQLATVAAAFADRWAERLTHLDSGHDGTHASSDRVN